MPTATKQATTPRVTGTNASRGAGAKASKPIIELRGVGKSFHVGKHEVTVLKNINLQIYPGEFLVILGPSGSGKSTLLNHLLGLEQPTAGKVFLVGTDITTKSADQIARLRYQHFGVVFQRPDWVNSIDVMQNMMIPLAIHNVGRKERLDRARRRLWEVGMDDHAHYNPMELSGGQQQKIALARALINDAEIIIADEPTGNLDSTSADKVMEIFKALNEKDKKTIIMVTHNVDYVRFSSRTIYIKDGAVVEGTERLLGS